MLYIQILYSELNIFLSSMKLVGIVIAYGVQWLAGWLAGRKHTCHFYLNCKIFTVTRNVGF